MNNYLMFEGIPDGVPDFENIRRKKDLVQLLIHSYKTSMWYHIGYSVSHRIRENKQGDVEEYRRSRKDKSHA